MQQGIVTRAIGGYFRVMLDDGRVVESRPRATAQRRRGRTGGRPRRRGGAARWPRRHRTRPPPAHPAGEAAHRQRRPSRWSSWRWPTRRPITGCWTACWLSAAAADIAPLLCWNKADLVSQDEADEAAGPYKAAGYKVIVTSAKSATGLASLRRALAGPRVHVRGPVGRGEIGAAQPPAPRVEAGNGRRQPQAGPRTPHDASGGTAGAARRRFRRRHARASVRWTCETSPPPG